MAIYALGTVVTEKILQIGSLLMCSLTDSALDPSLRVEHVRLSKKEVADQYLNKDN